MNSTPCRARPDFMLIDTSAGINDNVLYFNMVASETIVVVTPEPTSLTDAYALIKVLYQRHAKKRFSLLVNMVKTPNEAKEVFLRMAQATNHFLNLAIEQLGYVTYDENLPAGGQATEASGRDLSRFTIRKVPPGSG